MDGVARFSGGFQDEPWPRLIRTATYVDTLTFGTRTEARRGRWRGCAASTGGWAASRRRPGRTYRVDDPDLLLWVHCCEVDSLLTVARRGGAAADRRGRRPVRRRAGDGGGADRHRARGRAGLGRRRWPPTSRRSGPALAVTPAARDAYRLILLPPMPTWVRYLTPAQPAWGGLAVAGRAPCCRRGRGGCSRCPGLGLTDAAATAALKAFRQTLLRLPQRARRSPIVWAGYDRVAEEPAA